MATLILSAAGAAAGAAIGGPVAPMAGRALGALAGGLIDQAVLGGGARAVETPRLDRLRIMGSRPGEAIPRVFGRARIAGQVIWASRFRTRTTTERSGKGGAGVRRHGYSVSLAIALCEGPIDRVGRIWADGRELPTPPAEMRVHRGEADQAPDPLILAVEGEARAPAYRGTAYVVFEELDLGPFGDRAPQFSFEVHRQPRPLRRIAPPLAELVKGVALSPGSGEFSLETETVWRRLGPGRAVAENQNTRARRPDLLVSLDRLQEEAPACGSVSLVVSWFGDDLRCGRCRVRPAVETRAKETEPVQWRVGGLGRAEAAVVGEREGRPVYGGTPSDRSVVNAIREMTRRGLKVMFYPFLLMDLAQGNGRPDPYGAAEQGAYPWRGRITLDAAPGREGSSDRTAGAEAETAAFFGAARPSDFRIEDGEVRYAGPEEWSWRRFILHYAHLCKLAGGVDAFCVGSELVGLTRIRADGGRYPAVEALKALVEEARAVLGAGTAISYAADWSEYHSHRPGDGSGDVMFNMDPLWAACDFVGIDNYFPLADWRDADDHLDAEEAGSIYDLDYLRRGVEGGEHGDWFYATPEDREAQRRTPILDGQGWNRLAWTDDVSAPAWLRRNLSAQDGELLLETADYGEHFLQQDLPAKAGVYTISAEVAAVDRTRVLLRPVHVGEDLATSQIEYDLATGATIGDWARRITAWGAAEAGEGWWRIWATYELTDAVSWHAFRLQPVEPSNVYPGDPQKGLRVRRLQAVRGPELLPYERREATPGAGQEHWVFRQKALRDWHGAAHHDRPGGVRSLTPTAWIPAGKPIRFTEIGCPAVDKGANQPNVFHDPKSSESALPHFSAGAPDPHMQRSFLQAALSYWEEPGRNPVSPVYGGPMIDMAGAHVWTWDARPWPDFPAREEVWSDGPSHRLGHWITGRLGAADLAETVDEICDGFGVEVDVSALEDVVEGYALDRAASAREALQPLMLGFAFDAVERGEQVAFRPRRGGTAIWIDPAELEAAADEGRAASPVALSRGPAVDAPEAVRLAFTDAAGDYEPRAVEAAADETPRARLELAETPLAMSEGAARRVAERWLREARLAAEEARFVAPPSLAALEPGDRVAFAGTEGVWRIDRIVDRGAREATARRVHPALYAAAPETAGTARLAPPLAPQPLEVVTLDVPAGGGAGQFLAAFAEPWSGPAAVYAAPAEGGGFERLGDVTAPATMGVLVEDLAPAEPGLWAEGPGLRVRLFGGDLVPETAAAVLAGANAAAIGGDGSPWEVLRFRSAELVGPRDYRLTGLLRGQAGTEPFIRRPAQAGLRFVLLDGASRALPAADGWRLPRRFRVGPADLPHDRPPYVETLATAEGAAWRPFAPAHLRATPEDGGVRLDWVRRSRLDVDDWLGPDAPLEEPAERWRVSIRRDGVLLREVETGAPAFAYASIDRAADGLAGASFTVGVAQLSARYGVGPETEIVIDG